jgi:hypothetical protein
MAGTLFVIAKPPSVLSICIGRGRSASPVRPIPDASL